MARLEQSTCRLLRDEALVDKFNAIDQILSEAITRLPRFAQRDAVTQVQNRLSQLAMRMTRPRFSIGFIGPSQAGKSTTVGNLLSVSKDECPAPQGSGGPTTSVPTRLIPCREPSPRCPPGERHAIELQYMTTAEFRARVEDICKLLTLEFVGNLKGLLEAAEKQTAEKPHFKAADHRVLIGLLKAARDNPGVIQDTPLVEAGVYSKRREYATHQDVPSKYTLLSEVRIEFVTDAMSLDIEMIDLPGLGVDKESDDRLTLNFLPHLDGAFMFQLASQVKSAEISRLAGSMREQHHNSLGRRVWMVVTRCDDLNELQLNGPPEDPSQPSMFCHLNETLRNQGLAGDAVIFVGNAYHVALAAARQAGAEGVPPEVQARFPVVLKFDEADQPVIPSRCAGYEGQAEPWRRFVLDGGLSNLRETMQAKVAESVRHQTRRDVADGLATVIHRLISELEVAEQQSGMSVDQMKQAAAWSGKLASLATDVEHQPRYVQPVVDAVEGSMRSVLEKWGMPSPRELPATHGSLAKTLSHSASDEANTATKSVLGEVRQAIEEQLATAPAPDAPGLPTPLEHWDSRCEEYLGRGLTNGMGGTVATGSGGDQDFRLTIFAGLHVDPSPFDPASSEPVLLADYVAVMRQKINRVSHVYGTRLVLEMRRHLDWLADRYRSVGNEIDHIDPDAKAAYAELRSRLMALR